MEQHITFLFIGILMLINTLLLLLLLLLLLMCCIGGVVIATQCTATFSRSIVLPRI